jgi:hypothetical protein
MQEATLNKHGQLYHSSVGISRSEPNGGTTSVDDAVKGLLSTNRIDEGGLE